MDPEFVSTSSITCRILTYNTAGKMLLMKHVRAIASIPKKQRTVDIFALAFQECPRRLRRRQRGGHHRRLTRKLSRCLDLHEMVKERSFGALHLVVFVRKELVQFIDGEESFAKSVSVFSKGFRTKGAVAITFRINQRPLLFINCHCRFDQNFGLRRRDFRRIVDSISFNGYPVVLESGSEDRLLPFDGVFLFGGFNSRFDHTRITRHFLTHHRCPAVADVRVAQIRRLVKLDQLYLELQKLKRGSFEQFVEPSVTFAPTYKFVFGSSMYDWTRRVPAYTDRILYRKSASTTIRCLNYDAIRTVFISDHSPVHASYEISFG